MARTWIRAAFMALAITAAAPPAAQAGADGHDLPLPRGSRLVDGRQVSGAGFRATVDLYAKHLKKAGIPVTATGPYRVRGVDVMRFVRTDPGGTWLAVHVWRTDGVTYIAVVPRPAPLPPS